MDNSVASVSREFRAACLGRGPKMPDPPVLRILGSKLAVQGRYNERLFLHLAAEITVRTSLGKQRCAVVDYFPVG